MSKESGKPSKTRCFFANMRFRALVCDSNHKKLREKSSTITSQQINGCSLLESPFKFN